MMMTLSYSQDENITDYDSDSSYVDDEATVTEDIKSDSIFLISVLI